MNTTYKKADSSIPSYISTLANPMRRVHKDNILANESPVLSTLSYKRLKHLIPGGVVQCLGKGHCSGQRLLWKGHCHGWEIPMMNFFISQMYLHRVWERDQNGSCRLCRFPWGAFWLVSRIQYHLLFGDPLLDTLHYLQEHSCKDNLKIGVVKQK